MTTAVLPTPAVLPPTIASPHPVKWTCDDFYRLGELPSLRERKLMLIDGEILEMPPPSVLASISQQLIENWLRTTFPPDKFCVRVQLGLFFGINTDPVPDVAVVPGAPRSYARHPRTALLIVEVADTSVAYDVGEKASLYAAAGIQDYWVVDVNDRRLHVFRDPQPDPAMKYGYGYKSVQMLSPKDVISPLASPGNSVTVIDLLP